MPMAHRYGVPLFAVLFATLAACLFGGITAHADEPTHIYAPGWGLTLKDDGTGFYNDLARFLFIAPELGQVNYEILPYRRTNRQFMEDKTSCRSPSSLQFMINGGVLASADGYLSGEPFILTEVHLFTRHGKAPARHKAEVAGKSVAYAMGAATPALFKGHNALFIAVPDEVDKAKMLLSGRVDMITATIPDALFVFRALAVDTAPYAPELVLDRSPLGVDCHDTPANALFLGRLNARIKRLADTGELQAFFAGNGLDPAVFVPVAVPSGTGASKKN